LLRAYSTQLSGRYLSVEECLTVFAAGERGANFGIMKVNSESTEAFEGWNKN